jgi:hypothetical protein
MELSTTQEATSCAATWEHPALYETWPIQSTPPHPISPRFNLILSNHLCLGLPSGSFPLAFTPITYIYIYIYIYIPRLLHLCCVSHYLTLLHFIIIVILRKECKLWSSLLCSLSHPPVSSSIFNRNILLSTLFSSTLRLCHTLTVRDQFSHPFRTAGKLIVLYILNYMFFGSRWEDRRLWAEW